MTTREAIRRLSLNAGDCLALSWLHHNNIEPIHTVISHYFGIGQNADKAEYDLMQRMAIRSSSYGRQESPEEWFVKCVYEECKLLLNEKKAHG